MNNLNFDTKTCDAVSTCPDCEKKIPGCFGLSEECNSISCYVMECECLELYMCKGCGYSKLNAKCNDEMCFNITGHKDGLPLTLVASGKKRKPQP